MKLRGVDSSIQIDFSWTTEFDNMSGNDRQLTYSNDQLIDNIVTPNEIIAYALLRCNSALP